MDHFDLSDPKQIFDFTFQLYNLVSLASEDSDTLGNSDEELTKLRLDVTRMELPALTTVNRKRKAREDDVGIQAHLILEVLFVSAPHHMSDYPLLRFIYYHFVHG